MSKRPNMFSVLFKKYNLLIVLVLVILAVLFARSVITLRAVIKPKSPQAIVPAAEEEAQIIIVKAFKAQRIQFKDVLPVMGIIRGVREAELHFETAGVIESFNFREGEDIREGDIVASLAQRDAVLKLKYSKLEMDKTQKMFDVGIVDKTKLEQAKLEYESAKSDFDKTNIYAMRTGILGKQYKQEGEYVSTNDKVAVFVDLSEVYADFGVIEKDISKVKKGQNIEVFIDAYPGETYTGTVSQLTPVIEGRSKTLNARVKLKNPEGMLKPGMFARASIYTYEKENALVIPVTGMQTKENDHFVYVAHVVSEANEGLEAPALPAEGNAEGSSSQEETMLAEIEVRPIKVAYVTPEAVEIEEGLKEGELVIIDIEEELPDKAKVEIEEIKEGLTNF